MSLKSRKVLGTPQAQASAHKVKIDAGQGWKGQEITEKHYH